MLRHLVKMDRLTLEIMRHPDATDEQLRAAHDMYTKNYAAVNAVKGSLIQLGVLL
jgi:hypothetical protein